MGTQFFASEFGQRLLKRAILRLEGLESNPKAQVLLNAVRIISSNGDKFDIGAASNVDWIGQNLAAEIDALEKSDEPAALDDLYASFYRFVTEYELGLPEPKELSHELRQFTSHARLRPEEFTEGARRQVMFANHGMPLLIMKSLLGSGTIFNLRNIEKYSDEISGRFGEWDSKLLSHEQTVSQLAKALKEYETGFNFVGLHKGFDELSSAKRRELNKLRVGMVSMGVLALVPVAFELAFTYLNIDRFDEVKWALAATGLPVLSLTVLFIYYFRLAARAVDGAKSQLLQLELRKTLCRFIQSYVDYAKQLKEAGPNPLGKFESVIFSAIVNSDERMPATFDGVEQLARLVKAVKTS